MSPKVSRIYKPEDYGMSSAVLKGIDEIALEGIKAKAYPGCQILILKDGVLQAQGPRDAVLAALRAAQPAQAPAQAQVTAAAPDAAAAGA